MKVRLSDFVAHLRSSHFTVLVASLALGFSCLSIPTQEIRARQQLESVVSAIENWDKWASVRDAIYQENPGICGGPKDYYASGISVIARDGKSTNIKGEPVIEGASIGKLHVQVDNPCIVGGCFTEDDVAPFLAREPGTLKEFRQTWGKILSCNRNILLREPASKISLERAGGGEELVLSIEWSSEEPYGFYTDLRKIEDKKTGRTPSVIEVRDLMLSFTFAQSDDKVERFRGTVFDGLSVFGHKGESREYWLEVAGSGDVPYTVRTSSAEKVLRGLPAETITEIGEVDSLQLAFGREVGDSWEEGSFSESFPKLQAVVQEHKLWDSSLGEVDERIDKLVAVSNGSFSIVGVVFSGRYKYLCGISLVFLAQFYFLLHLQRFMDLKCAFEVPEVIPWIGIYPAGPPRWLAIISGCIVPVLANIFALYRAGDIGFSFVGSPPRYLEVTLFLSTAIVVMASFYASCKACSALRALGKSFR